MCFASMQSLLTVHNCLSLVVVITFIIDIDC